MKITIPKTSNLIMPKQNIPGQENGFSNKIDLIVDPEEIEKSWESVEKYLADTKRPKEVNK